VTIFARPTTPSRRGIQPAVADCRAAIRRLLLSFAVMAGLAASLTAPAPAGAVVTHVGPISVGLQARVQEHYLLEGISGPAPSNYLTGAEPAKYANAAGNPVVHQSNTWAIFWDPEKAYYHGDWEHLIDTYLHDAAEASGSLESVFAVDAQYTDKSNVPAAYKQSFRGGAEDTTAYPKSGCVDPKPAPEKERESGRIPPTTCLTSEQVANQLESYIKAHNLPTGLSDIYYVLTPPGVTVCLDGGTATGHCSDFAGGGLEHESESYDNSFCSYHADINPSGLSTGSASTILYGVIPWTAGTFEDGDFFEEETPGWECQDGGYDPSSKPAEQVEISKARGPKEESEFKEKNAVEKAEIEQAKLLEGPHEQEPNQIPCPTSDGYCDYGLADLIINQLSSEQQNIVTDPLLNGWKDPAGYENTDECRFFFATALGGAVTANPETDAGTLYDEVLDAGDYYVNNAFNYAGELLNYPGIPCLHGAYLVPQFTAPSPVNNGEPVSFNGMESDISLDAGIDFSPGGSQQADYATYTWNFGDGTPTVTGYAPGSPPCETPWLTPCAGTVLHSYEYGGAYEVTLTVHDIAGDSASVSHVINVSGPSRPAPPSTGATMAGAGAPGAGPHAGLLAPVAAAVISPQSLRTALRKGLVVSYSVNEQVAGHFEVLLSRSLARKLHIVGTPATEMPAGSPPAVVIAKSVLVTTKAGRSAVHIAFSKRTIARLAHVHKVPLMLRLIVHNAALASTSVLTSATLSL
jgi:hypothetical protein